MRQIPEFFFSTAPNQLLGTLVNLAILGLGAYALIQLTRAFRRLRAERAALTAFSAGHRVKDPDEIRRLASVWPGGILARRVHLLHELQQDGAEIDAGTLSALALAELEGEAAGARWAANTVVLLGLGGTLIGLSQAVIAAGPMLADVMSSPAAIAAIMRTFSGLGTAFSTTLMGIIWAVALGLLVSRLRAGQGAYLQRLEEVSLTRILPFFRTSPALAMVEAARKLSALETHLAVALTEIVGQLKTQGLALTKVVEDSVGELVADSRSTGRALQDSLEQSLSEIIREMRERGVGLTGTVDRSFATLTEELRSGTADLHQRIEAAHSALARLLGDPGSDMRTLSDNLAVLQRGVTAMGLAAQRMTEMTPAIEEAIARQVDRQARDLHDTMHTYASRLAANVDRQAAILDQGFARLEHGIGGFGDVLLSQLQSHDAALLGQVGERVGEVGAAVQGQTARLDELRTAVAHLNEAARELDGRGAQDREAARQIREAAEVVGERLGELTRQVDQVRDALTAVLRPAAPPSPPISSEPSSPAEPARHASPGAGLPGNGFTRSGVSFNGQQDRPSDIKPAHPEHPPLRRAPEKKAGFFSRLFGGSS